MPALAAALALLPGLLVVRAPWTAVGPLSLAFWAVSAWWSPPGRGRFLAAALGASCVLVLLRLLPKHEVAPPPGWQEPPGPRAPARPGLVPPPLLCAPSLWIAAIALALLAPLPLWHHAPGSRLAFQTTAARLVVWRDAIPEGYEPLLPLQPFGAHAPALGTLAADVSLLTGLDPGPALLAVVASACGLVLVGLYALLAVWLPPQAAALGALVALAASPWPGFLAAFGAGEALLALAFALPAVALLVGHASRSSAVAASLLLGAGALAQPLLAAAAAGLATLAIVVRAGSGRAALRPGLAASLALVAAGPGLSPLARALSPREALAIAGSGLPPAAAAFVIAALLAVLLPAAFAAAGPGRTRAARAARTAIAAIAGLLLVARVHGWFASGRMDEATRAALARVAATAPLLASICADEAVRDFVPALAGRRAGDPGVWMPAAYADEWRRREPRPCDARLSDFREGP